LEEKITIGESSQAHENKTGEAGGRFRFAREGRATQLKTCSGKSRQSKLDSAVTENASRGIYA
jgi:hypothetical protein